MMGDRFPISTGSGGSGLHGGIGGRGGDVHLNYNIYGQESPDTSHLMSLPRANYARHDSAREDAPSSCLEGTRVAILKDILSWSESANNEMPPVYWLNGLAGIGKSTIAKTVAEHAEAKAMLGASFFFSRSDKPLQDPRLVFPTLAFQLAQSDGAFKNVIVEALQQDPTAGYKVLLPQIQELILNPLLKINPHRHPTLIILDALDECEEKGAADILRLVFSHATQIPFLRILITSRPQPHLSTVFNTVPNLAKTVLHEIEASVVQEDIRRYLSTELAKIPEKLCLSMPADWVTEIQRELLVEKSGKLFIYAATAIRFIGDDRVRDPHRHLNLMLYTSSRRQTEATPYSQLDNLYMGVLRNSLSESNHRHLVERFQVVVGSIVVLREPLPLSSLTQFVQYERRIVEATLYHLHSVIVPPSEIHEAPRIYHPSFLEFITDPSRCSMTDFLIVPIPKQELRHAIRCFELMGTYLKRDVAGISNPSLLNREVEGFEERVRYALPPEVQYACRYWASHLSLVELGEKRMMEALEGFLMRSILWWFEAMSLIGCVSTAASSIQEARHWVMNSKCKSILVTILSDASRFILTHGKVIRESALHVYHSALPFTPQDTVLYRLYCEEAKDSITVLHGVEFEWPKNLSTLPSDSSPGCLAFSPDGLHLASGSTMGTIQLWDILVGTCIAKLDGHFRGVATVAFSPNGLCLVSGSRDALQLWDGMSGALIARLGGYFWWATGPFSPNGLRLISCYGDGTLQLWDGLSGAPVAKLAGHSAQIWAVAFSPDGLGLASYSKDRTLRLWDAMSGVPIAELKGPTGLVASSPNGLHLASGSFHHQLRLWDAMSSVLISPLEGRTEQIMTIVFSPDGLCLASGSTRGILQLWGPVFSVPIATLKGHKDCIDTITFSPDGLRLASSSYDSIWLWDVTSRAPISRLKGQAYLIAFSPSGLCLATGSYDGTLQLWDAVSSTPIAKLEGHSSGIGTIAFSPDGVHLVSGSFDNTLRLWDVVSTIAKPEGHSSQVKAIALSSDGLHLASISTHGALWLWNAMSGAIMAKLRPTSGITTFAFSPDGSCLASGFDDGTLQLWNAMSGALMAKLRGPARGITTIAFSPDGSSLASGFSDGTLQLWNVMSGALITGLDICSTSLVIIKFSPDGLRLVLVSDGGSLWYWGPMFGMVSRPRQLRWISTPPVTAVAFSPDGLHLASAHSNCTIQLWDSMLIAPVANLRGHSIKPSRSITFSLDGYSLISHVGTETLIWDFTSQPFRCKLSSSTMAVRPSAPLIWSLDGQWIQVEQPGDPHVRHICCIPIHYSVSTDVIVSGEQTPSRIAVGCKDGRVIILALPSDLFNLY